MLVSVIAHVTAGYRHLHIWLTKNDHLVPELCLSLEDRSLFQRRLFILQLSGGFPDCTMLSPAVTPMVPFVGGTSCMRTLLLWCSPIWQPSPVCVLYFFMSLKNPLFPVVIKMLSFIFF